MRHESLDIIYIVNSFKSKKMISQFCKLIMTFKNLHRSLNLYWSINALNMFSSQNVNKKVYDAKVVVVILFGFERKVFDLDTLF